LSFHVRVSVHTFRALIRALQMYTVRGKSVWIERHAFEGMSSERPPVSTQDVMTTIKKPDGVEREAGTREKAWRWIGQRTIMVYYDELEDEIHVKAVSATRRKI